MGRIIIEDNERVVKCISKEQKGKLICKLKQEGFFVLPWFFNSVSPGLHVFVENPKDCYPMAFNSCLPAGFIGRHAELVNLFRPELDCYHKKLRKIYYSIEKK